jgi:hypothetical protein
MNPQVIAGGGALGAATEDKWREQILTLLNEPVGAQAFGMDGRRQVEQHYATRRLADRLAQALKFVAGGTR